MRPSPLASALRWVLAAVLLAALSGGVRAEPRALLVGVSHYTGFPDDQRMQLEGPPNDVRLLRTLLERRGFAPGAVQVLADGVPGATAPTRQAILGALDRLVERTQAGDFVFLYFAGHGSQMPANPDTPEGAAETDGLHEIFLPADTGRWNPATRRVDNAIADHELVSRLDALIAKDAFVWAVFDACHAATLMRGVVDVAIRYRHVSPTALGVPPALLAGAPREVQAPALPGPLRAGGARARGEAAPARGGFVAFYAAQTTQTTPEMPLPGEGHERAVHGLFTFSLAEALSAGGGATYRQLAQHLLARYAAQNIGTPTPLFTGSALDAQVFGAAADAVARQWPLIVDGGTVRLPAGLLSQLREGAALDLLPDALAAATERLGTMQVVRAGLLSSQLQPLPGAPAVDLARLPAGAVARLVRLPAPAFDLRVVAPPATIDADGRAVAAATAALRARPRDGLAIQWVGAGEAHDLRLWVGDGRLWLVPPTGQWYRDGAQRTASLEIGAPRLEDRLSAALQRAGRAQNLLRIAGTLPAADVRGLLEVQALIRPAAGASRALVPLVPETVRDGDTVATTVRNVARQAVDLTVLYVDAAHGIKALYPHPRGSSNRIEAGDSLTLLARIDAGTTGRERLLLIAVAVVPGQGERQDFSFLEQDGLDSARSGMVRDGVAGLFAQAAFGAGRRATARGTTMPALPEGLQIEILTLDVQ